MEDASDEQPVAKEMPVPLANGLIGKELDDTAKLNGDTNSEDSASEHSSDGGTTVTNTDSENNLKRKLDTSSPDSDFKGSKRAKCDGDFVPPTNPYFNESLFELSGLHDSTHNVRDKNGSTSNAHNSQNSTETSKSPEVTKSKRVTPKKKKPQLSAPRLPEHPGTSGTLVGLQPVIWFKCRKCEQSKFPSLSLLKEHFRQCNGEAPEVQTTSDSLQKLFVTRRNVFLCSACGCYYENYNLFLHVYKVHGRFACLYCSAIFSSTDKFLFHLLTKHNCVPKHVQSEKDFFDAHKQPCYLMCLDCEKIFGDGSKEHFYGHVCNNLNKSDSKNKSNKVVNNQNNKIINKSKGKSKGFVEHVTGDTDTPVTTNVSKEVAEEERASEAQPQEEVQPSSPIVEEIEKDASIAMETTQNESVSNVSNEEQLNVPNSDDNIDCGNDGQLASEDEIDDNAASPEHAVEEENKHEHAAVEQEETRKVPKVTLKIRQPISLYDEVDNEEHDSDDSDKLTMEMNTIDESEETEKEPLNEAEPSITIAGADIPVTELELEQPLDKFDLQSLLQKCLRLTIPSCIYCNHARKISVNGKQLGLHAIAEHRFSAVVNSITAEELIPESFVVRIQDGLPDVQDVYFSLDVQSEEGVTFTRTFECFQCRYATNIHKELYLHNRKMHAKSILLCIMCKSNFYSYSELICHMCPGVYDDSDLTFRCCICDGEELPSAFRLMVHLRKRHNACDVCLEQCHNQSRLSNHVWKHKLHHFCYRCGIAYRNKPDITKHLFWKHGTESVLCKKCLQKKWPHVFHFCMPPSTFTCDECNLNFTKAVSLKVHKRLHSNEKPHPCTVDNCTERFISKKLLLKHEFKHRQPVENLEEDKKHTKVEVNENVDVLANYNTDDQEETPSEIIKDEVKPKPKVDVLDLPALNLSESDSSDSEEESKDVTSALPIPPNDDAGLPKSVDVSTSTDVSTVDQPVPVFENIWDDFKNYQAQKDKPATEVLSDSANDDKEAVAQEIKVESNDGVDQKDIVLFIMQDHDYSLYSQAFKNDPHLEVTEKLESMDHDYCSVTKLEESQEEKQEQTPEEPKPFQDTHSSHSSSDSDSSSCNCSAKCSCSLGSSSSSSDSSDSDSSTSEGRRKQQIRREQRKHCAKVKKEEKPQIDVVTPDVKQTIVPPIDLIIEETDLDTSESETDEEFYDRQPQKIANQLMAEKRKELVMMAEMGPVVNGAALELSRPSTPSLPETEVVKLKPKKSKSKKKKRKNKKRDREQLEVPSTLYQYPTVSPLSISLPKNSTISTPSLMTPPILSTSVGSDFNSDFSNTSDSLRASKRRRIPNKFYGYSSDDDHEKHDKLEKHPLPPVLKWRKSDLPSPLPLLVPPITLKAIPAPVIEQEPVPVQSSFHHPHPALFKSKTRAATESNGSTSEEEQVIIPTMNKPLNQPPLYCYCRCPYDEVSEMIGCDADDCLIEWFHFECVGIMVPPKGQWFCPDCRKKRQQRRELSQL